MGRSLCRIRFWIISRLLKIRIYFSQCSQKHSDERLKFFLAITKPQSDNDFIEQCFQNPNQKEYEFALAIRKVIAKLGLVEPEFIRSEACFEDLDLLPFWKNCGDIDFDSMLLVETIEEALSTKFSNKQLNSLSVRDPDLYLQMKVFEFVSEFYQWFAEYY